MNNLVFLLGLGTFSFLTSFAPSAYSMDVKTIGQIADSEAFAKDSRGYMRNAIEHHLCLQKQEVIADILHTYKNDGSFLRNNMHNFSLDEINDVLQSYSRDQIVAAEVVAFARLSQARFVGGRAGHWLHAVTEAQANGHSIQEGALLAVAPGIVFDTFVEVAFAGPTEEECPGPASCGRWL